MTGEVGARVTFPALVALTGVTYRQLDHWVRRGYVVPVDNAAPGSGMGPRWFDAAEVERVRTLRRLTDAGLTNVAAVRVADGRAALGAPLSGWWADLGDGLRITDAGVL